MMNKIKILFVITSLGRGGVQEHLRLLIKHLDPAIFDIWIAYGNPDDHLETFQTYGATLINIGLVKSISPLKDLRSFVNLLILILRQKFDIVHTHMTKAGILGRAAARIAGTKAIASTGHGMSGILDYYYSNSLSKKLFIWIEKLWARLFTDAVILLTKTDFESILHQNIVPRNKLRIVPNGVDIAEYNKGLSRSVVRGKLNIPEEANVAIMVGRLSKQKAPEVFITAAERVLTEMNNTYFLLVGDGPKMERIQELVASLHLDQRVYVLGKQADVPSLLRASDVFVLPSIYEGMPISILEAMALGLPVIATDIAGNRDLVKHNENGFLIKTNSPLALAEQLLLLFNEPLLGRRLGEAGKEIVEKNYSDRITAERTIDIYYKLLDKKKEFQKASE